jgi:hypothetical protein
MEGARLTTALMTILLAIVSTATVAALVSNKANTSNVIGAAGTAFSSAIKAAVSPITGQ